MFSSACTAAHIIYPVTRNRYKNDAPPAGMLLSTLRALNALVGSEDGYESAETVRLPPRPDAEAQELERVAAEIRRLSKRIHKLMKEGDRMNEPYYALMERKNRKEQSYRGLSQFEQDFDARDDARLVELQQAFDERNMQVRTLRNELSRLIEQWQNLNGANKGHPPVRARATLMSSNSPRDVTVLPEEHERAWYQQTTAELQRRRAAMVAKQTRIAAERRGMVPLEAALAEQNVILQRLKDTPKAELDNVEIFQCTTEIFSLLAQIQAHQRRINEILDEP